MRIAYSKRFLKEFRKCSVKIKNSFKNRLEIFIKNPSDSRLNNHKLLGELNGCKSINISGDWRAVYEEFEEEDGVLIFFVIIGTHAKLYK